jgi:cytochrome c556
MPHARRKLTVALSIALGIAAPAGVLIAAQSAQDLQKARHHHYHELGKACKNCHDTFRGPEDHDH